MSGLSFLPRRWRSKPQRWIPRLRAERRPFIAGPRNSRACILWRLHPLKGARGGQWAISVSANWRVIFEFEDGHAYAVNYEDYH
ncbi:MAG: hypothetical protein F4234_01290 [Gammaproteobacteria bacterium]|nr:hypothetical protein [Gammaproteobacteria bacterium]MYA68320.1 hypothetical protein [Gammaproteobacteria bacterium]MYE29578.1 hypothetical protein [Gammaproteobacteria bacterium]MYE98820.1 hypothetical protein [Gammaproteobacteria bacterium]MYH45401.1 hypothetical protein [Gammaproteobacteria bacterium]